MEKDFWLARWKNEQIGFHEQEVNPFLTAYWQALHLAPGSKVLVPLCGKSVDMQWLRSQGHPVVGVELSEKAAQDFFKENGYTATFAKVNKFDCFAANDIEIKCGDFFDLSKADLATVKAVYDRASMVALPPEMRQRYVQHMAQILPSWYSKFSRKLFTKHKPPPAPP